MKFGVMKPPDAVGGVTVHSIRQNGLVLKKGTMIGAAEVEALAKAGVGEIVVAQLEPGDISEDEAAASIADLFLRQRHKPTRVNHEASSAAVFHLYSIICSRAGPIVTAAPVFLAETSDAGRCVRSNLL